MQQMDRELTQPPAELRSCRWHQLRADLNQVIERMEWLSHAEAIALGRVHHGRPDEGGYWVRSGTPLTARAMYDASWRYLRPCDADAPRVSWE